MQGTLSVSNGPYLRRWLLGRLPPSLSSPPLFKGSGTWWLVALPAPVAVRCIVQGTTCWHRWVECKMWSVVVRLKPTCLFGCEKVHNSKRDTLVAWIAAKDFTDVNISRRGPSGKYRRFIFTIFFFHIHLFKMHSQIFFSLCNICLSLNAHFFQLYSILTYM